jgi:hypothetical protein
LRGWEREGEEWVVREGVGAGVEMTQTLYAYMNNKRKKRKKNALETHNFKIVIPLRHSTGSSL